LLHANSSLCSGARGALEYIFGTFGAGGAILVVTGRGYGVLETAQPASANTAAMEKAIRMVPAQFDRVLSQATFAGAPEW
jgi:hypothetical protein